MTWVALSLTILGRPVLGLYIRLKLAKDRALGLSGMLLPRKKKNAVAWPLRIHDDFSQRMALLALGLENAEDAIGVCQTSCPSSARPAEFCQRNRG